MSNRTNMALADAWLTADVALTRKKRKDELSTKEDEYDALLATINKAQMDNIKQEDLVANVTGWTVAGGYLLDAYMTGVTGGAWGWMKTLATAGTMYGIGQEAGRAGYQVYADVADIQGDMDELIDDINTFDWVLSDESMKYERGEGEELLDTAELMSDADVKAYQEWADEFYNWEDHAINVGTDVFSISKAGKDVFGDAFSPFAWTTKELLSGKDDEKQKRKDQDRFQHLGSLPG